MQKGAGRTTGRYGGKTTAVECTIADSTGVDVAVLAPSSQANNDIGNRHHREVVTAASASFVHTPETIRGKPPAHGSRNWALESALATCPTYGRRNYNRRNALRVARLANKAGLPKLASRIGWCSHTLGYGADGRLVAREACRARECSIDQASRSARWAHRLHEAMPMIVAENAAARFLLITVTVPSVPILHLRDAKETMHRAIERMAKRKAFAPIGYVRNTEETLTQGPDPKTGEATGYAHPHGHLLCMVDPGYFQGPVRKVKRANGRPTIEPGYMTHRQWQLLWGECLGLVVPMSYLDVTPEHEALPMKDWRALWENDDAPIIDVRAIKGDLTAPSARKALYEVTKYGTKPLDLVSLAPKDFRALHFQNKGARAISICGALAPYLKNVEEEYNDETPRQFPDVAITARWHEGEKRYLTSFTAAPRGTVLTTPDGTPVCDYLEEEREKRAWLNRKQLPDIKLLVQRALLNGGIAELDIHQAQRIADGHTTRERIRHERMVRAEDKRRFWLDDTDDRRKRRSEAFWQGVLTEVNQRTGRARVHGEFHLCMPLGVIDVVRYRIRDGRLVREDSGKPGTE